MGRPLVVMEDVNKHFGDLHVLKDIDLTVDAGEVVVVIGPSGSGKSTLCRTVNRLETIESGTITIDGEPLPEEGRELARLRADVGMVFQAFNLFAHKSILENVTLGPMKVRGHGSVIAELVRSGVHSLPAGQAEAGYSIGLTRAQVLRSIQLPRAVKAMLPALVSQLVVINKDTALGYITTYPELLQQSNNLASARSNVIPALLVAAALFIVINFVLAWAAGAPVA